MKTNLLAKLRNGDPLSFLQRLTLILQLAVPAMLTRVVFIIMSYIDTSMIGRLSAGDSAAIALVSSSIWLIDGVSMAFATGFTVQVAHKIGAKDEKGARNIIRQGLVVTMGISLVVLCITILIHTKLPVWLGGGADICAKASRYFLVRGLGLPVAMMQVLASGSLQCSGNIKVPSIISMCMGVLDIIFNAFLIFPTGTYVVLGHSFSIHGAGLGIVGAALGTLLSEACGAAILMIYLFGKSPMLKVRKGEKLQFVKADIRRALKISLPLAVEEVIMCGAQITSTAITAPLGNIALSAHSFSITSESICYMPVYGIGTAATTLIGQSIGAGRDDLSRQLAWFTTILGVAFMSVMGVVMYHTAPFMMNLLTSNAEIAALGIIVLRIEAFAEPMYGASIVISGAFRGEGDTLTSCILNFISMWAVRIPLAARLAPTMGLKGVWTAMAIELTVRGILFIIFLIRKSLKKKPRKEEVYEQ